MALTDEEKSLIHATVPLLEAGGEQLTSHFYARMMERNPEVRHFFNQTHQKDGTQARALAKAVLLYAKNIDNLEALGAVAPTIIEKHVAFDIHKEHYPIVGTNLIAAMVEVLGSDVATKQVTDAWTKAFFQLADILSNAEAQEFQKVQAAEGGWSGFRTFVIKQRDQAARDVVSLYLEPRDGGVTLPAEPGQYLTVRCIISGVEDRRNYSVSANLDNKGYRITVKNIGLVSGYLHALKVGDSLELRPPVGNFKLDEKAAAEGRPLVFIAGGIGITPLAAMLHCGAKGRLLYYAHSDEERALLGELRALPHVEYAEPESTRPSFEEISKLVPPNASVYYTGPTGFMESLRTMLRQHGLPDSDIHYELFGSGMTLQ